MKPKHIYLVRHGESEGNVNRVIHATVPDWKIPLTDTGRQQARETGQRFFVDLSPLSLAVYVSPYLRARQTWEEINSQSFFVEPLIAKEDPRLREQEWGNLRAFYRFLHGESGADVYDRCTGFLDTLYRDFEKVDFPSNVLIVTHGYTLRVLLKRWLHWSVEDFHRLKNPKNGQIFRMTLNDDGKYRLDKPFPTYSGASKFA